MKVLEIERSHAIGKLETLYRINLPMTVATVVRPGRRKRMHPGVRRELALLLLRHAAKLLKVKVRIK